MRRKATMNELKVLARGVKNGYLLCIRQTNIYDTQDIADDCKRMIDKFANEFILQNFKNFEIMIAHSGEM